MLVCYKINGVIGSVQTLCAHTQSVCCVFADSVHLLVNANSHIFHLGFPLMNLLSKFIL